MLSKSKFPNQRRRNEMKPDPEKVVALVTDCQKVITNYLSGAQTCAAALTEIIGLLDGPQQREAFGIPEPVKLPPGWELDPMAGTCVAYVTTFLGAELTVRPAVQPGCWIAYLGPIKVCRGVTMGSTMLLAMNEVRKILTDEADDAIRAVKAATDAE